MPNARIFFSSIILFKLLRKIILHIIQNYLIPPLFMLASIVCYQSEVFLSATHGGENDSWHSRMTSKIMCNDNRSFFLLTLNFYASGIVEELQRRQWSLERLYHVFRIPVNFNGITHVRLLCMLSNFLDANPHPLECKASLQGDITRAFA